MPYIFLWHCQIHLAPTGWFPYLFWPWLIWISCIQFPSSSMLWWVNAKVLMNNEGNVFSCHFLHFLLSLKLRNPLVLFTYYNIRWTWWNRVKYLKSTFNLLYQSLNTLLDFTTWVLSKMTMMSPLLKMYLMPQLQCIAKIGHLVFP